MADEPLSPDTDWAKLKTLCTGHDTILVLRTETVNGEYRFSLSAQDRWGKVIYDNRANDDGRDPQDVVTALVTSSLSDWWQQ
jgi:hypothetical protein